MALNGDLQSSIHENFQNGSPIKRGFWRGVQPIADIRGADTLNYRKGEKILRCKLATCARLVDCFGWSADAHVFASARIDKSINQLLCMPSTLECQEVTAGSLIKLDFQGNVIDSGSTELGVDLSDALFHSSVLSSREDLNVLLFVSSPPTVSMSVLKCGLLPLCQEAMLVGKIGYLELGGEDLDHADSKVIAESFTKDSKVLFVRNYGVLIGGESVEELFFITSCIMDAIETQLNLLPFGLENLHVASAEVQENVSRSFKQLPTGDHMRNEWRVADVHFQALVRLLDNAGYSTGYVSDDSASKRAVRSHSTTEIAPTPLSMISDGRRSAVDRTMTPTNFQRIESAGPASSKHRSARWVVETGFFNKPRSSSVRILNTNRFAPQGSNPKELKQKVKEIRKEYYDDTITSGPQSSVLEGVTWEEARKIKASGGAAGDGVRVSAASRGIIQRDHQKEALFYKNYTLGNPFENITDHDLEKYKEEVEKKNRQSSNK